MGTLPRVRPQTPARMWMLSGASHNLCDVRTAQQRVLKKRHHILEQEPLQYNMPQRHNSTQKKM